LLYQLSYAPGVPAKIMYSDRVSLETLDRLPSPVARYFRRVLKEGQARIHRVRFRQSGTLRTNEASDKWSRFTASQTATATSPGFVWNAKVRLAPFLWVRVRDAYVDGIASGRVSLLSAITLEAARGGAELNSGALHRYLAEAVWYPTALLPGSDLQWTPIDDQRARATLSDHGTSVALEFRFNQADEVTAVYAPGRYRKTGKRYELTPWEGHFSNYGVKDGIRVPLEGEVSWHLSGQRQPVWRGKLADLHYDFAD
jgi:hypothetical protein